MMTVVLVGGMYSFFDYLRNADVDYLDISKPEPPGRVTCGMARKNCQLQQDPIGCAFAVYDGFLNSVDGKDVFAGGPCKEQTQAPVACSDAMVTLDSIQRDLSQLRAVRGGPNHMIAWAALFFILMLILILNILIHDLALLQQECRTNILSWRSVKQEMPKVWGCISAVQCLTPLQILRERAFVLWIAVQPIWFVCQVVFFLAFVYPLSFLAGLCCWCPLGIVRVSRVLVFQTAILVFIWSLIFVLVTALEGPLNMGRVYGVFWHAKNITPGCLCYCEYRLRVGVKRTLVFFASVIVIWAFSVAFRALKGLRRPNWANLFSVLYAVPIEVFPVMWERGENYGGGPIDFRKKGEPVQGEPAFDPFCLMDEQVESGRTTVRLRPEPQDPDQVGRWSRSRDPTSDTVVGCCGFPQRQIMADLIGASRNHRKSVEIAQRIGGQRSSSKKSGCTIGAPDRSLASTIRTSNAADWPLNTRFQRRPSAPSGVSVRASTVDVATDTADLTSFYYSSDMSGADGSSLSSKNSVTDDVAFLYARADEIDSSSFGAEGCRMWCEGKSNRETGQHSSMKGVVPHNLDKVTL